MHHPQVPIGHDVFRDRVQGGGRGGGWWYTKGLGKTSERILEFLLAHAHEGPHTQVAVAEGLGVNRSTVGRNLPRLVDKGLVTKGKEGLRAEVTGGDELDSLATMMGLSGTSMRQRARYGWELLDEGYGTGPEVDARTQAQNMIDRGKARLLLPEVSFAFGVEELERVRATLPEAQVCPHRSPCKPVEVPGAEAKPDPGDQFHEQPRHHVGECSFGPENLGTLPRAI
jgi:DNA-binding transcriptional ArsR family regulator